jgi:hypothetical protein
MMLPAQRRPSLDEATGAESEKFWTPILNNEATIHALVVYRLAKDPHHYLRNRK